LLITAVCAGFAVKKPRTALFAFLSFHTHLICDLIGGRGPSEPAFPDGCQWPIPYFLPFDGRVQFAWEHQWELNAWQNFAITFAALGFMFYWARARGVSPLEGISLNANRRFVETIRHRFPIKTGV